MIDTDDEIDDRSATSLQGTNFIEERRSTGEPTGIEEERPDPQPRISPDDAIREPFDPDEIEVTTRTPTIDLLVSRLKAGAINLEPEFQRRRGIWTDERQSKLIKSILLRIPLPTFYAAEDADENWEVVDGIQRLSAISRFIDPASIKEPPLSLIGLDYLTDFEGHRFDELPPRLQRRLRETELVVHLIRFGTPDIVKFNIFARINTGGLVLSSQELRHALIGGPARALLKKWASLKAFRRAIDNSIRDERMADRELVLRFAAFRLTPPPSYRYRDFDRFLGDAMKTLNQLDTAALEKLRGEFEETMTAASDIFGRDAFRKRYVKNAPRYPINKALFEAVAVALADVGAPGRSLLVQRREEVRDGMITLMNNRDFDSAISQGTGDIRKVQRRFRDVSAFFQDVINA